MPEKPLIWIVGTVILLNVLDVPGKNQDREQVLQDFKTRIERGDKFLLPFGAILETRSYIARLTDCNYRRGCKIRLKKQSN